MLSFIGFLPAFIAFRVAMKTSPSNAFIKVYLPTLLCLPDYYRVITPGLPDPTFSQGVAIVLVVVSVLKGGLPGYKFSHVDLVVAMYAGCVFNSELQASGYSDAQNLMFEMLFSVMTPYFLAKSFIEPGGLRFVYAKKIVICLSIVAMINIFETRFGMNPFQLTLQRFFPGQGEGWIVTFRFGMARTAGPFGHALLAGIVMMVGFRLQRWLQFYGAWPDKIPQMKWLPIKIPQLMTLIMTGGFFITFAKGAWLAGFLAGFLVAVGRIKNRVMALTVVLGFVIFVLIPATGAFLSYASVGRANAKDDNQETAAYRYELITGYMEVAQEKSMWGWGLTKWPVILGMPSIDNAYLLIFLMHGKIALSCIAYILLGTMVRLLAYSLRCPPPPRSGASLPFTLASIFLGYTVAIATVYFGKQTVPVLFMILGWSESFMISKAVDAWGDTDKEVQGTPPLYQFRRVL